MGLDADIFAVQSDFDINTEEWEVIERFKVMSWRKNYELNKWMFRLYQKKTGFYGDKYKIFNGKWLELDFEDLKKLKNDIICQRVRYKNWIHTSYDFVDVAMAKLRKGKRIYYSMCG